MSLAPLASPRPTGMKTVHFTGLILALAMLGSAMMMKTVGEWVTFTRNDISWSEERTLVNLRIGNTPIHAPANMVRYNSQRVDGRRLEKLDLAVLAPDMRGYDASVAEAFADTSRKSPLILITIEANSTSLPTQERMRKVYPALATGEPIPGPADLMLLPISSKKIRGVGEAAATEPSGGSDFVVYSNDATEGFASRCFVPTDRSVAALCHREIRISSELILTYRFRQGQLRSWRQMDAKIQTLAKRLINPA